MKRRGMSDNLVLDLLRAIRGDIAELKTGQIGSRSEPMSREASAGLEIKERLGFLEGQYGSLSRRVDRIDGRLDRIERRLDIADAPAS